MKKRFGKKQLLLAGLVVALGAAVYLNYYFATKTPPAVTTGTETTATTDDRTLGESVFVNNAETAATRDYFEAARDNRQSARQEALDILTDLVQSAKTTEAERKQAVETAAIVAAAVEQESNIEDILKAKGFADCVVYIEDDNCHVVLKAEELAENQTLQVMQVVAAQSNVPTENINIVAVK